MAARARLRCVGLRLTLMLPWWPEDVSWTLPAWEVSTMERPGRAPLDALKGLSAEAVTVGFVLRNRDFFDRPERRAPGEASSVGEMLETLGRIAVAPFPSQLLLGDFDTGLWRLEAPSVEVSQWGAGDLPSVADVSLTLRRASDAAIRVGPAARVRGGGSGFASRG